eukprot:2617841-Pleurochrysis_carterae.AAC.1
MRGRVAPMRGRVAPMRGRVARSKGAHGQRARRRVVREQASECARASRSGEQQVRARESVREKERA